MYDGTAQHAPLPYKFTGKERDAETGLDYFGARYNASNMGRFMTPDPLSVLTPQTGDPQSLNLYSYVENDAPNAVDPDGQDCVFVQNNAVWVASGNCNGIKNGTYVAGTVDPKSGTYDPNTGTVGFNYTPYGGGLGAGNISGVYPSTGASDSDRMGAVTQGTQMAAPFANLAFNIFMMFANILAPGSTTVAQCLAGAPSCTKGNVAMAGLGIFIPDAALAHVLEGHTIGGTLSAGKSIFNAGEDVKGLIQAADSAPAKSVGSVLIRTVDAGRAIGVDRNTGQLTSMYTVITKNTGELITAYPGRP